jgi:hypothetical protein
MKTTRGWAGLRAAAVALGLIAFGASGARASALMNYSTSGSIDPTTGVSGSPVISFNSVLENSFFSPSAFSLGEFQVAKLPDGQTTKYTDTPFKITFLANTVNGVAPSPNETPIVVTGTLNGSVTGANQSNVTAKFDPITNPDFHTGAFANTLSITNSPLSLVPSTTNSGQTSAQAFLTTGNAPTPTPAGQDNQVPEPTSVALFLTAIGGLGLRHRLRAARQES